MKGVREIKGLDQFTECKGLWLESNGIYKIEGLDKLTKLCSL